MMDTATNKTVVQQYIELWNTGCLELADTILAPHYIDHAHPEVVGLASFKQAVTKVRTADPDFHITVEGMLGQGDQVALVGLIRMNRRGQAVTLRVGWFVRLENHQMVELRTYHAAH